MGNSARDPVDHSRTTRKRAGETLTNTSTTPGLATGAVAVAWVLAQHRRVGRAEAAYLADHPEADTEPPTA